MKKLFTCAFPLLFSMFVCAMDKSPKTSPSLYQYRRFSVNDAGSINKAQKQFQHSSPTTQLAHLQQMLTDSLYDNKALSECYYTFIYRIAAHASGFSMHHTSATHNHSPKSAQRLKEFFLATDASTNQAVRTLKLSAPTTQLSYIETMLKEITQSPHFLIPEDYTLIDDIGLLARQTYIENIRAQMQYRF